MKILYITNDLSQIGGIEKYNKDVLNALKSEGFEYRHLQRQAGGFFQKLLFLCHFFWLILFSRPSLVFCSHLHHAPLCLIAKKLLGVEYFLAVYGIEIRYIGKFWYSKSANNASRIITISEFSKSLILSNLGSHSLEKIYMMPSAVDTKTFFPKQKSTELVNKYNLSGKKVILTLSRLSTREEKGQDRVLKSLPSVMNSITNAVYLIVGGGYDERVTEFLKRNPKVSEKVFLTGPIADEEKVDYYNLADIYILPSKLEGFGIVFIESLACGVPVIASDGYGCREGLLDGELGRLVDPDDTEQISQVIYEELTRCPSENSLNHREELANKTRKVYGIEKFNLLVKNLFAEQKKNRSARV